MRRRNGVQERDGVRLGQRARDLDGSSLGRVTALYETGFACTKGFAILFHSDSVVRYDEVRGEDDGVLVVARSRQDLPSLARGELPPAWRIPVSPEFPDAATPPEARLVVEDLQRGAIPPALPPVP